MALMTVSMAWGKITHIQSMLTETHVHTINDTRAMGTVFGFSTILWKETIC